MEDRRKHLVFISYYFPPMGGGGVQRITKFLKYFNYQTYRVTALTVKPSYFYSNDESLQQDVPDDVQVIRSGSLDPFRLMYLIQKIFRFKQKNKNLTRESGGGVRKIATSIFVPDSRLLWLPFALWKLWRLQRSQKIDTIIASMPPFTTGLIATILKPFAAKTILDFRDAWTNNPYLLTVNFLHRKLSEKMEAFCLFRTAGVIFVNPALETYYREKYPQIRQKPTATIRNGYDPEDFPASIRKEMPAPKQNYFELGIMGTVYSRGNCPESLIRAIQELNAETADFRSNFRLVFIGKWSPDFLRFIKEVDIQEIVEFIPYRPHRQALERAARFDALSLSIDSELEGSAAVTPGRIYEYLFLKKPILALCPLQSDLANLVRDQNAGEVVDFKNIKKIKDVIGDWIANRENLKDRYTFQNLAQFSRESQAKLLMEFID